MRNGGDVWNEVDTPRREIDWDFLEPRPSGSLCFLDGFEGNKLGSFSFSFCYLFGFY
jgi:hypothetical protein